MNSFKHIKTKLYNMLGEEVVDSFKNNKIILAGGAITSLFTNKDINDFDLYFRSSDDLISFVDDVFCETDVISPFSVICNSFTSRSLLMMLDGTLNLQPIHFKFFEKAEDIFESFDFTINMGAFDFSTEEFILHDDFLLHNSQRILHFNKLTTYPIISQLRVQKYNERGYKISKRDAMVISLAICNLQIETWDDLMDQLSGFYGLSVDDIFDTTKEFSLEEAMEAIEQADVFESSPEKQNIAYDDIINSICKAHNIKHDKPIYKSFALKDGKITSPIYKQFIWEIGKTIHMSETDHGIYAFHKEDLAIEYSGDLIGELEISEDAEVIRQSSGQILIKGDVTLKSVRKK